MVDLKLQKHKSRFIPMKILNFKENQEMRESSRASAKALHEQVLNLSGNDEYLKEFIDMNNMDEQISLIFFETSKYLKSKNKNG